MKPHPLALALAAALVLTGAARSQAAADPQSVEIQLKAADGKVVGKASLTEGPRGVLLRLSVQGLAPGWHGLHFHEKADCAAPDFKSAGGHVHGMADAVHGLLNPVGNEAGDLPNLYVAADGTGQVELFSTFVSLKGAGGRSALLDADGSALVIHASPDDYASQPIGNAGARVACGVIAAG
ncbi:Cu-Zn family superoxide dismutase [Caulobacter ginsengisoli]|uniref:Superoxide dismutase [Cu-Zn] n=1 Tax=Caulobacter ginsengisoli TaxID=400775 RepID=A0ABU0IPQ1_9CAUL|nr:superoxide dismutase family protein [Caulobacter ginsengisoli]MDQ0463939.1 Cu-Zn family superoxide dismutase [Caulobacter ginsengisoli]